MRILLHTLSRSILILFLLGSSNVLLKAQHPSLGGGVGLNALRSNGTYWVTRTRPQGAKEIFGNPNISINLDYNFQKKVTHPILGKIYNPIFNNPYLQLRGQVIFNHLNISYKKYNTIATAGGSLLVFPFKYNDNKRINLFSEIGYRAGWNNTIKEPFHASVMGAGGRYNLGKEWQIQANVSYAFAFNDYLDHTGRRGLLKNVGDRYLLVNFSLLKSFLTEEEKRRLDGSRDSLAMCKTLAKSAAEKAKLATSTAKGLQSKIEVVEQKIGENKVRAAELSELAKEVMKKTNIALRRSSDEITLQALEGEIDSLSSVVSNMVITHRVELEKATTDFDVKNDLDRSINDVQVQAKEARQLLTSAFTFLPENKDLERESKRVKTQDLSTASRNVLVSDNELKNLFSRTEGNRVKMKSIVSAFDRAAKDIKDAFDMLDRAKQIVLARKN